MNSTTLPAATSFTRSDYYVVCPLSLITSIIAIVISILILILVWRTKSRLHTVRHLLMCNTCIATILYCTVQTTNYIFLIFIESDTSDMSCRWRGYFGYLSICAVTYSYLIQTISRFFISLFLFKYRWLITFKAHYILIFIQWFIVIILPLPTILTKDISFRPNILFWIARIHLLHVIYTFFAYYIIPTLLTFMIYIMIYYRVKRAIRRDRTFMKTSNNKKRDLKVLRNIIILLSIYSLGGLPSVLFLITGIKPIFLIGMVSISLAMAVEKACMCILDRDIRQVIKHLTRSRNCVIPLDQAIIGGRRLQNVNHI